VSWPSSLVSSDVGESTSDSLGMRNPPRDMFDPRTGLSGWDVARQELGDTGHVNDVAAAAQSNGASLHHVCWSSPAETMVGRCALSGHPYFFAVTIL
jgi:hypothetical protein